MKNKLDTRPKISIITVVKDDAEGIKETIESVISQCFKNYEYIVICCNSTDGTESIIKEHKRYITKLIIESDYGIYFAMNKGIELCNGEYINFLNSGNTYCSTDTLEIVANNINRRTEILSGSIIRIQKDGEHIYKSWQEQFQPKDFMFCYHETMFTKREIFNDIKFKTIFKVTADYEWALNCYQKKTKFDFINTAIVNFKEGGFSEVNKIRSRIEELFIQSMYFRDNTTLLEGNAFSKLKLYSKGNNSFLPKLLSEIKWQLENLNISDIEINLFGYGSLLKYTNILSELNYKRIYDRNFDAINKSYECELVDDPCQIKKNTNEHFLITALGYESEIEQFLKSKMINPKQIFKFEI